MRLHLIILFFILFSKSFAQHPLVGTWKMVSIRGIDADGERFSIDTSQVREIKIITPTHYMLMAFNMEGDSMIFNRCYAGELRLEGSSYKETPIVSSLPIFDNVNSNFLWKLDGERFIQSGTFTRPDGKTIILDELVFERVTTQKAYDDNPAIGFWELLSSSFVDFEGRKSSRTSAEEKRYHIITPTHWMRISHHSGKFNSAMGGSYSIREGKTFASIDFYSTAPGAGTMEVTYKAEGNKLYADGVLRDRQGRKLIWQDVFVRK